jgi:(1->4)-alpha-D-glucan 1-alpha-D-glucosylmutase
MTPLRELAARFGAYNSLSQTLIKLTAPGVPDIYQGNELWDFSLVDPDNRRPVDYRRRMRVLRDLLRELRTEGADRAALARRLLERWRDGRIKLYLTHATLTFRRAHAGLFRAGSYEPLSAAGERADHVVAFSRRLGNTLVVVAAPRLLVGITPPEGHPVGAATWRDASLTLPEERPGRRFRHVLTGMAIETAGQDGTTVLPLAEVLRDLPLGLLVREGDA